MELVWAGRDVPARLAAAMLLYSGLTWLGMLLFGRETWREHAEVSTDLGRLSYRALFLLPLQWPITSSIKADDVP
jgi:hypothetical protein